MMKPYFYSSHATMKHAVHRLLLLSEPLNAAASALVFYKVDLILNKNKIVIHIYIH